MRKLVNITFICNYINHSRLRTTSAGGLGIAVQAGEDEIHADKSKEHGEISDYGKPGSALGF